MSTSSLSLSSLSSSYHYHHCLSLRPQSLIRKPGLLFIQTTRLVPSAGFGYSHYCPRNPGWITINV